MKHFEDRSKRCDFCYEWVEIKHNQIGGVWYLSGWENAEGRRIYGTACSKCFGEMDDKRKKNE